MMKRTIWIWILMLLPLCMVAQENGGKNKYQRQRDFEDFKKQRSEQFQAFKDSLNKEFAKMLEQKWEDYQVFVGNRRPSKPEPSQLPVAPKDSTAKESLELPINQIVPADEQVPSANDQGLEGTQKVQDDIQNPQQYKNVDVNFYMEKVHF